MPAPDLSNPYAPPRSDGAGEWRSAPAAPYRTDDLGEALRRLNEFVADPRNLESDTRARGARFRTVGWVCLALGLLGAVLAGMAGTQGIDSAFLYVGVLIGAVFAIIGLAALAMDLSLVSRSVPAPPDKTLKSFLKAIVMARYGYAWTCLSPSARDQTVPSPPLGPVQTLPGTFPLRGEADMKAYAMSFARTSGSVMRAMGVQKVILGPVEGDVARVEAHLSFQSWPRWVSIIAIVGFVVFRPLVILGAIFYFVMRKRHSVRVMKTMLRAHNGVWYVYDGDVVEGAGTRG
ncbi:MAG: hypothetical protein ACLQVI_11830 [Polyangiaceae bacterium]